MGNHSTTWPCLGGSKRVAYLVFCTSLGTPCDTGGWEDFDSNSIVFHSFQVKLWGDMGDGSGTLPDHLWRCTHLHFTPHSKLHSSFGSWHVKPIWNIGLSWHSWATLVSGLERVSSMEKHLVLCSHQAALEAIRPDGWTQGHCATGTFAVENGRMSGTCYWNMKKQIIGALFVERFTYTPENFYNQDLFFDNRGG